MRRRLARADGEQKGRMDKKEWRGVETALESAKTRVNSSQNQVNCIKEILGNFQILRLVQKVMEGQRE